MECPVNERLTGAAQKGGASACGEVDGDDPGQVVKCGGRKLSLAASFPGTFGLTDTASDNLGKPIQLDDVNICVLADISAQITEMGGKVEFLSTVDSATGQRFNTLNIYSDSGQNPEKYGEAGISVKEDRSDLSGLKADLEKYYANVIIYEHDLARRKGRFKREPKSFQYCFQVVGKYTDCAEYREYKLSLSVPEQFLSKFDNEYCALKRWAVEKLIDFFSSDLSSTEVLTPVDLVSLAKFIVRLNKSHGHLSAVYRVMRFNLMQQMDLDSSDLSKLVSEMKRAQVLDDFIAFLVSDLEGQGYNTEQKKIMKAFVRELQKDIVSQKKSVESIEKIKKASCDEIDQLFTEELDLELAFKEKNLVGWLNAAINLSGFHNAWVSDPNYGILALKYCYKYKDNGLMRAALFQVASVLKHDPSPETCVTSAVLFFILDEKDQLSSGKIYIHTDLKYYYLALTAFISEDYVHVRHYADMSQYPEAFWLKGMLDYRDGNYAKSYGNFEKAVKMGLRAAYANLAHLSVITDIDEKATLIAFEGAARHEDTLGLKTLYWQPLIDELKESGFFGTMPPCNQKDKLQSVTDDEALNALVAEIENIGKTSGNKKKKKSKSQPAAVNMQREKRATAVVVLKGKPESIIESREAAGCASTKVVESSAKSLEDISQRALLLYKLDINFHLKAKDYDMAMEVVKGAVGRTNAPLSHAALVQSGLWVMRMMINDSLYFDNRASLDFVNHHGVSWLQPRGNYTAGEGWGESLRQRLLSDVKDQFRADIFREVILDAADCWLTYLFTPDQPAGKWKISPLRQLREYTDQGFVDGYKKTFAGASLCSLMGHTCGDFCTPAPGMEKGQFYNAANTMNQWREKIKRGQKLPSRVARSTLTGKGMFR